MIKQLSRIVPGLGLALAIGTGCETESRIVAPEGGVHRPNASLQALSLGGFDPATAGSWSNLFGQDIAANDGNEPSDIVETTVLLATSGRAAGHAAVHGTVLQNIADEQYSFIAASTDYPAATGQVEVHLLTMDGHEVNAHAEVTCLSIVGSQAWIGSRVRRIDQDGQEVSFSAGLNMVFRVQDSGEGVTATDMASLVFFPAQPNRDLAFCTGRPTGNPLRTSEVGNIQVTPSQ